MPLPMTPERGLFILGFMTVVTGGALLLYALRAPRIMTGETFDGVSPRDRPAAQQRLFRGIGRDGAARHAVSADRRLHGLGADFGGAAVFQRDVHSADDPGGIADSIRPDEPLEKRPDWTHRQTADRQRRAGGRIGPDHRGLAGCLEPACPDRLGRRTLADPGGGQLCSPGHPQSPLSFCRATRSG